MHRGAMRHVALRSGFTGSAEFVGRKVIEFNLASAAQGGADADRQFSWSLDKCLIAERHYKVLVG